jgi:hypothetical protein
LEPRQSLSYLPFCLCSRRWLRCGSETRRWRGNSRRQSTSWIWPRQSTTAYRKRKDGFDGGIYQCSQASRGINTSVLNKDATLSDGLPDALHFIYNPRKIQPRTGKEFSPGRMCIVQEGSIGSDVMAVTAQRDFCDIE